MRNKIRLVFNVILVLLEPYLILSDISITGKIACIIVFGIACFQLGINYKTIKMSAQQSDTSETMT